VTCPHCLHEVSLTWRSYFHSRFGHHVCQSCQKKFRVIVTASSVVLLLVITIVAAAAPAVVAFFLAHNFWYTIAAYVLFLVAFVLPFDRWLDNKVRPTKALP